MKKSKQPRGKKAAQSQPVSRPATGVQPVIIATKNLTKVYGKKSMAFKALNGINLEIRRGESVAIIGKSGSGKSTLMHCLALLDAPTKGEIYIGQHLATKLKKRRVNRLRNKNFGFVFQQFFMNARDSVLRNVELPLKIAGIRNKEQKRRAMEALKIVELEDKAKSRANDLSGGQKQRVCIARAIVNNPSVIFADEPTGNLDSITGARVEDLLFQMNKEKGITLIIVTHDEDLAARCSRQIYIKDGQIVSEAVAMKGAKK
jgi:putative ABC transport system ATP-binding protein